MNPVYLQIRKNYKWSSCPTPFDSYHDAILAGQELAPRNFMVDTGSRVPTRAEQLLHDPLKKKYAFDEAEPQPKRRGRPSRTSKLLDELV